MNLKNSNFKEVPLFLLHNFSNLFIGTWHIHALHRCGLPRGQYHVNFQRKNDPHSVLLNIFKLEFLSIFIISRQTQFLISFHAISRTEFLLPPFSLLRDFSFQNTSEHFAIRFRQSYLIWEVCDVTAIELSSKE